MARETEFIVYVSKDVMGQPDELFDAVLAHFIKKGMDIRKRKRFLAQFMRAPGDKKLALIQRWVQVRDAKTFPFNKLSEAGIDGAKAGAALRKATSKLVGDPDVITEGDVDLLEENVDEDTEATRGVPVDDGADEE